ncbi:MAG: hypothetical protein MJ181_05655 [Treponema sp.]|nr:hypothetical protein [Treponema sp.]
MFARTIKKALVFFVVDILILIGIFVLQFSNDSIITEKFGNLQITLSETKDNNNNTILRNKFNLSYNGVTLSCDDVKPAVIRRKGMAPEESESVALTGWVKQGEGGYVFNFSEGVKFQVNLSDSTEKGALSFLVELPKDSDITEFYIPYTLSANSEISSETSSRILLGSKKSMWEINASSLENQLIRFTAVKPQATFAYFEQTVEFKFASLSGSSLVGNYDTVIRTFRDAVVSSYKASTSDALLHEPSVVAYVAEQAARGNYVSAMDEVPQTFKRSENRTFLSAPFFNNLAEMNKTLEANIKEKDAIIRKAVNNNSLSLFTVRNIADYMYLYPNSGTIKRITENAGEANAGTCSLAEAAGILRTYVEMMPLSKAYASHMEGNLNDCVEKIEKACKMEGSNLTLSENGTFLSVVQAVEIGDALLRYGQFIGDQSLIAGGKAIISSYVGESTSFDMRTLSDLYPVLVHDNTYYPHFVKLYVSGDNVVWAWTSAENIDYERGEDRSITFYADFPTGNTHYMIIRGINPFRGIYIYDMAFRTDPRFENYNSSGYVYDAETKALLLKSRHKNEKETIRLTYAAPAAQQVEEKPAEETQAQTTETSSETPAASTETPAENAAPETPATQNPGNPNPALDSMAAAGQAAAAKAQAQAAAAAAALNGIKIPQN